MCFIFSHNAVKRRESARAKSPDDAHGAQTRSNDALACSRTQGGALPRREAIALQIVRVFLCLNLMPEKPKNKAWQFKVGDFMLFFRGYAGIRR